MDQEKQVETESEKRWREWHQELERLANGAYGEGYDFSQECWYENYHCGQTPAEALAADMVYWDGDDHPA